MRRAAFLALIFARAVCAANTYYPNDAVGFTGITCTGTSGLSSSSNTVANKNANTVLTAQTKCTGLTNCNAIMFSPKTGGGYTVHYINNKCAFPAQFTADATRSNFVWSDNNNIIPAAWKTFVPPPPPMPPLPMPPPSPEPAPGPAPGPAAGPAAGPEPAPVLSGTNSSPPVSPAPPPITNHQTASSSNPNAAVIGGAVGGAVGGVLIIGAATYFVRRRTKVVPAAQGGYARLEGAHGSRFRGVGTRISL